MTNVAPPPIQEVLSEEGTGLPTIPWILFYTNMFQGDTGTDWTPTFDGLTEVGGAATITGRYFKYNQQLVYFRISVTPATNTSAVAGTTYVNNFPLDVTTDSACSVVSGNLGGVSGMVVATNNRIYPSAWTTVTVPLTIVGTVEAR